MAKERKARQQHLEGMEPPSIAEIEEKAEEYVEARNARMKLLTKEIGLQEELATLMRKHKLKNYEFDGSTVELTSKEKVKVRKSKDEGEDEEE